MNSQQNDEPIMVKKQPLDASRLLQLPEAGQDVVLQQLDQRSLFNIAECCSKLCSAVPAHIRQLQAHCSTAESYSSLVLWLSRNSSLLDRLTQCSVVGPGFEPPFRNEENPCPALDHMPCSNLRQLHLHDFSLQLEAAGAVPGVLAGCRGLTALQLQGCVLSDTHAAFAAIAALTDLQHLSIAATFDKQSRLHFRPQSFEANPQQLTKLTNLSIDCQTEWTDFDWATNIFSKFIEYGQQLQQLTALVNLQHLRWADLPYYGLPGGFPSQLSKLTCLDVTYHNRHNAEKQFQNLSSLTALQELKVGSWKGLDARCLDLGGMQQLSQLTSLKLADLAVVFTSSTTSSTSSTSSWPCLIALQKLVLSRCTLPPAAVAALTQLRALPLERVNINIGRPLGDLLRAVAALTQLTQLDMAHPGEQYLRIHPPAAAFTALTASSHLRSLKLSLLGSKVLEDWVLFRSHHMYPHLRTVHIEVSSGYKSWVRPLSEQQVRRLSRCCPALESLSLALGNSRNLFSAAWEPLQQLSALTHLALHCGSNMASEIAARLAGELTRLQKLELEGVPDVRDGFLLRLTTLTALQELHFIEREPKRYRRGNTRLGKLHLRNKVSPWKAEGYPHVLFQPTQYAACIMQHAWLIRLQEWKHAYGLLGAAGATPAWLCWQGCAVVRRASDAKVGHRALSTETGS
jgi:hypothetical protein